MADYFLFHGKNIFMGLWFFNNYDNPQMTYRKYSQNISMGKLLHAPRSQIAVSSICELILYSFQIYAHLVCYLFCFILFKCVQIKSNNYPPRLRI